MEGLIAWILALHVGALLLWSASLFALPALYAVYPSVRHPRDLQRLQAMARFTFLAIASPAGVVTIIAGTALIHPTGAYSGWLVLKLMVVTLLVVFHAACGRIVVLLHDDPMLLSSRTHLSLLAVPAILIPCVLWLVLAKPL